jgi:hypothetical protein
MISTQMTLPRANWDGISAVGSAITVSGWAFDPDGGRSVPIHIYVDGQNNVIAADSARPDVGAAYAGAGSSTGFAFSTAVTPGTHTVCVYAIDVQFAGRNTALGCRAITTQMALPAANWDSLSASGATITVSGWTFDPDDGGKAVPVHVYVDGQNNVITAGQSRVDVGAAFPGVGNSHGFSWSTTVSPGEHLVCAYAIDVDMPWRNTALGCRTISTQMALPRANWDSVTVSGSTVSVSGWAFDPDDSHASVPVHVYLDGQGMPVVTADAARPDVGVAFGVGDDHGFSWSKTVASGEHRVCLYAIDVDQPWRNTPLGCQTVRAG